MLEVLEDLPSVAITLLCRYKITVSVWHSLFAWTPYPFLSGVDIDSTSAMIVTVIWQKSFIRNSHESFIISLGSNPESFIISLPPRVEYNAPSRLKAL